MANINPTAALRLMRLNNTGIGFMGHAIAAPACGLRDRGAVVEARLIAGPVEGRIMSISRGYPPRKKR